MHNCVVAQAIVAPSWEPLTGTAHEAALAVLLHGPLSRTELAERLGLTQGTVTRATRPLVESGLLVSRGPQHTPAVGRPSEPLDIAAEAWRFVGVKITDDAVYGVLTDLRAQTLRGVHRELGSHSAEAVSDSIADIVDELASEITVTAIGVSLGGNSTGQPGHVYATFLGWDDVPLADMVQQRTGLPTVVSNDVAALVRAAQWFGVAKDLDDFAMVTIGAGVGYGLAIHGEPVRARHVELASLSHLPLDPLGPLCERGHRGCASAMLSTASICRNVGAVLGFQVSYSEVLALAAEGVPAARHHVDAACRAAGYLVAHIALLTTCENIILSGEGVHIIDVGRSAFDLGVADIAQGAASVINVRIEPAPFDEWARGAAVSAIQTYVLGD